MFAPGNNFFSLTQMNYARELCDFWKGTAIPAP